MTSRSTEIILSVSRAYFSAAAWFRQLRVLHGRLVGIQCLKRQTWASTIRMDPLAAGYVLVSADARPDHCGVGYPLMVV
jgi:hypothetical protein